MGFLLLFCFGVPTGCYIAVIVLLIRASAIKASWHTLYPSIEKKVKICPKCGSQQSDRKTVDDYKTESVKQNLYDDDSWEDEQVLFASWKRKTCLSCGTQFINENVYDKFPYNKRPEFLSTYGKNSDEVFDNQVIWHLLLKKTGKPSLGDIPVLIGFSFIPLIMGLAIVFLK